MFFQSPYACKNVKDATNYVTIDMTVKKSRGNNCAAVPVMGAISVQQSGNGKVGGSIARYVLVNIKV